MMARKNVLFLKTNNPPVPQLFEHALHKDQELTTQLTGQQLCIQLPVSESAGQGELQYGLRTIVRFRTRLPAPHFPFDAKQDPHAPQRLT